MKCLLWFQLDLSLAGFIHMRGLCDSCDHVMISRTTLEEFECGVKLFIKFLGGLMTTTSIKPVSAEIIPVPY